MCALHKQSAELDELVEVVVYHVQASVVHVHAGRPSSAQGVRFPLSASALFRLQRPSLYDLGAASQPEAEREHSQELEKGQQAEETLGASAAQVLEAGQGHGQGKSVLYQTEE